MNKLILVGFLVFLLPNCGVKKQEPGNSLPPTNIQIGEKDLPKGVLYSSHKKFLVKSSVEQIQVGEEKEEYSFRIEYNIVTSKLAPLNNGYRLEVKYGMPSMPQMKIRPATITYPEAGKVSVLYHIDMAQDWRMDLKIVKTDGTLEDTLTYNYYIPE